MLKLQAGHDISYTVTYDMSVVTSHKSDICQSVHYTYILAYIYIYIHKKKKKVNVTIERTTKAQIEE